VDESGDRIFKALAKIQPNLLDVLGKFQEVELQDVEIELDELELFLPQIAASAARAVAETVAERPTELLREVFAPPPVKYNTQIIEVKLGATKTEGGSRD